MDFILNCSRRITLLHSLPSGFWIEGLKLLHKLLLAHAAATASYDCEAEAVIVCVVIGLLLWLAALGLCALFGCGTVLAAKAGPGAHALQTLPHGSCIEVKPAVLDPAATTSFWYFRWKIDLLDHLTIFVFHNHRMTKLIGMRGLSRFALRRCLLRRLGFWRSTILVRFLESLPPTQPLRDLPP